MNKILCIMVLVHIGISLVSGQSLDAVIHGKDRRAGKVYFFKGKKYARFDLAKKKFDKGYPKYINNVTWPRLPRKIDSGFAMGTNTAYFFSGSYYYRWNWRQGWVDEGYPLPIAQYWPGLWKKGIDAAFHKDGYTYFFKGNECVKMKVRKGKKASLVTKARINQVLPGCNLSYIHAATTYKGKAVLLQKYVLHYYDFKSKKIVYTHLISDIK